MPRPHSVVFLAYERFQILDLTGPAAVFASANYILSREAYAVSVVSPNGGLVASNSGVSFATLALTRMPTSRPDTFLVVGADEPNVRAAMVDPTLRHWLPRWVRRAGRFGSVCSGTFVLAALGLLEGKRVATHWEACEKLAAAFPNLSVDANALYVVDGKVWTSAGVTTGVDMALAMVEHDQGAQVAGSVAKRLVVYARRPGHQSQFSTLLSAQIRADNPFVDLVDWMQSHLDHVLDVPTLAARAGLAERSFYRKFLAATGESPAQFVEALRLDAARTLLACDLSIKTIAAAVGLQPRRLNAAFERRFGMSPQLFRGIHGTS
ncbi:MAG TPA: DJ-1/PfpI family protein [Burkholderiaceae bacterium]|nr:DJ-1/PfpI family protein [Burkholderiaceae bacterium]